MRCVLFVVVLCVRCLLFVVCWLSFVILVFVIVFMCCHLLGVWCLVCLVCLVFGVCCCCVVVLLFVVRCVCTIVSSSVGCFVFIVYWFLVCGFLLLVCGSLRVGCCLVCVVR